MLTKKTSVPGIIQIWALPKASWEINTEEYDGQPFKYALYGENSRPYQDGAVMVVEHRASFEVPAGVDLLAAAIATLQKQKTDVLAEAMKKTTEIEKQINQLQLIGYEKPTAPREVEGELMDPEHPPAQ